MDTTGADDDGGVGGHTRQSRPVPDEHAIHEQHARVQESWDQLVCRVERLRSAAG